MELWSFWTIIYTSWCETRQIIYSNQSLFRQNRRANAYIYQDRAKWISTTFHWKRRSLKTGDYSSTFLGPDGFTIGKSVILLCSHYGYIRISSLWPIVIVLQFLEKWQEIFSNRSGRVRLDSLVPVVHTIFTGLQISFARVTKISSRKYSETWLSGHLWTAATCH